MPAIVFAAAKTQRCSAGSAIFHQCIRAVKITKLTFGYINGTVGRNDCTKMVRVVTKDRAVTGVISTNYYK